MLAQAGVGDHGSDSSGLDEADIAPFVQLVHGDLGTMERVISAMERRAIDMTPEDRLQFVVFVFGLFHFKMAAADAIWRLLVTPKDARKDPTSFMAFVERLRPKSSNKLINNAKFREHQEKRQSLLTDPGAQENWESGRQTPKMERPGAPSICSGARRSSVLMPRSIK